MKIRHICSMNSRYGTIGIGICWDRWFPEKVRSMAVLGAEMLLFPAATGEIVASAGRDKEEILYVAFDLDALMADRLAWGLFRDRRPDTYKVLAER